MPNAITDRPRRSVLALDFNLYSRASQTFKTGMALSLTQDALDAGGITAISQGLSEERATTPGHEVS